MIVSRRNTLLCASVLGMGALSSVAHAATESTHTSSHVRHKTVTHSPVRSAATPATTAPASVIRPVAAPQFNAPVAVNRSHALRSINSETQESVVVTGSALGTSNNTNANPVQIVTSKQIQQTGATTLSDFFQRLPSVGSSSQQNTDTNGGGGVSCTDIRNLGASRVLVLVDGKRAALNSGSACFDMNAIPVQQVASVEILKDGGSELYGADAVSGVINIKLRHDIDSGNITIRGGITGHGDAPQGIISGFKGFNFDHGKGNVSLFGQYMTQGGVRQRNRSWSSNPQIGDDANPANNAFGSSYSPYGSFSYQDINQNNHYYHSDLNGNLVSGRKRYSFAHDTSLMNQIQDASLNGDAHYDFDRHFSLYSNVMYSHTNSMTNMAAEPVYGSVPQGGPYPTAITVPANYPGNTTGEDLTMTRRMTEWGPRETQTASDTLTAKVGAQGDIYKNWKYDISYTYGSNMYKYQQSNIGSYPAMLRMYGLKPTSFGDPNSGMAYDPSVCSSSPNCVLSSPFSALSPAAAQYSNLDTVSNGHYQLRDLNLRIHNNHVVKMPWAHGGDIGIALGMEHRGEQLTYNPDPALQSGVALTNPQGVTSGGFNVTEGYLEGKAQLLKDAFLAKDLTIDAQGRYSSYNTFGSVKNWKASIDWAPTQDVRFRGTIGTSFRQPSVYQLYGAQALGFPYANDPCENPSNPTVVANCVKAGIKNPATFQQQGGGQVPTLSGGNTKLQPEAGRTYTFGAVITPRWIPGLSTSVTFWHYNVSSSIGALPTNYILNNCYNGSNPELCNSISRSSDGQISQVSALDQNLGTTNTSGIDWDFDYRIRLTAMDSITISNNLQNLVNYSQQQAPGGQYYHYTNAIFYPGGTSNPRWRDYATATWQHGAFSFTYMANYTGGMRYNDTSSFMHLNDDNNWGRVKVPAIVQQDISVGYRYHSWNMTSGINNITNKAPTFFPDGATNTDTSTYSSFVMGRNFWLQISKDF